LPGVKSGLKRLKENGHQIYIHTNQSGVARGYYSEDDVKKCMQKLFSKLEVEESFFSDICVSYGLDHSLDIRRKPSSYFGKNIIKRNECTARDLIYIGDRVTDLQTAFEIGCIGIGINTGIHDLENDLKNHQHLKGYAVYSCFNEVVDRILSTSCNSNKIN